MKHASGLAIVLLLTVIPMTTGCGTLPSQSAPSISQSPLTQAPAYDDVLAIARQQQHTVDDGWFYGEMPRLFKSAYLLAPEEVKARFAIDFANMLKQSGQNMLSNWDSYVPYQKRSDFAESWWSNPANSQRFNQQTKKMKIVWIHEAVMDASELWWRAFEKRNENKLIDSAVLAHDAEQKMVFDYTDHQGRPRSFSDEYVRFR